MSARRALGLGCLFVMSVALVIGIAGTAGAQVQATASVEPSSASIGAPITVSGSGFAPGTLVSVELCGNEARRGSADCDQSSAVDAGVSSAGEVAVQLILGTPPSPCPCVVKLTGLSSSASATVPITVQGAPVADRETLDAQFPDVTRQLAVVDAHFDGAGPWTAWFGASPKRTLIYTVENTGNVAVQDSPVIVALGKGGNPTGIVRPPPLGTLQPGESRTYRADVSLGPFAFGEYRAVGRIPGFAEPVTFTASTTTYPWALGLIVAVGLLEFMLIKMRNWARARVATTAEAPPALPVPIRALNPAPVLAASTLAPGMPADLSASGLSTGELEEAIVLVLTETLRSLDEHLGDRTIDQDEASRLAGALALEVSSTVATTLDLTESDKATIAGHLTQELGRVLSGRASTDRDLVGTARP